MKYIKRIIDEKISEKLKYMGALAIKGPKWCGKTTSAKQVAKSVIEMQDPDYTKKYIQVANEKPSVLLQGEKPRLIDEWQLAPQIWNAVRYAVDKSQEKGQYILTGSSTPVENDEMHSGTGRFGFITMKTLTLFESGDSNGKISLKDILEGKRDIDGIPSNITYERLAYLICRGGWPAAMDLPEEQALNIPKDYIDAVCDSDISRVDGVSRNPELTKNILKAYARQTCTIDSNESLVQDVISNYGSVSIVTILDYLNVLKKLYLIEEIPAWNPNIRSKTSIRTAPKKTFVDPSLAVAALDASPNDLMYDPQTFGLLFENLVNRDLSVYVEEIGGYIRHFRDRFGLECDNVIHFSNGRYGLVEVKLSSNGVKSAEEHLLKIVSLIKEHDEKVERKIEKIKEPDFLMVITGTDSMAYTTKEGVLVVPIGCLKQ